MELAAALRARIGAGAYGAGGAIESEADLGRAYGVSRVTVRRALEELRREGLLTSRKGAGWFVVCDPVRQALGRVVTIESALAEAGITPRRQVLAFAFERADAGVAAGLGLAPGSEVLRVQRLNLAGEEPFAIVTVWVPAALGAQLSRAEVERSTFYDLLPLRGVELAGATQTIAAVAATPEEARLLRVPAGTPLLACRRTTRDRAGQTVLFSDHRYPGHRTEFEVEFPHLAAGTGWGPSGLRVLAPRRPSRQDTG
ncbi:MAG TPA: GntR family transcriptional regulator [Dehalococcoidia bacterium]|nr:GntR family transcriptional regulator [Dehalococcoidia bacterium]